MGSIFYTQMKPLNGGGVPMLFTEVEAIYAYESTYLKRNLGIWGECMTSESTPRP